MKQGESVGQQDSRLLEYRDVREIAKRASGESYPLWKSTFMLLQIEHARAVREVYADENINIRPNPNDQDWIDLFTLDRKLCLDALTRLSESGQLKSLKGVGPKRFGLINRFIEQSTPAGI